MELCSDIEIFNYVFNGTLSKYPKGFWCPPDGIIYATNILKYLLEVILNWKHDDIIEKYDAKIFGKYKLNGMLSCVFNSSPFNAIDAVYPNVFKRWQFSLPKGYWKDDENVVNAIRDIYENTLGIKDINEIYTIKNHRDIFLKYGLYNIPKVRNKTYHEIIDMVYHSVKEENFYRSSQSFYDIENGIEKFKQIINDKHLTHEDLIKMTNESLREYNLHYLFVKKNNMIIYDIMEIISPNEFKPWEFPKIKSGFWNNEEHIYEAIKWLIEDKLHIVPKNIIRISRQDFYNNGLKSLIFYSNNNHIGIKNIIRLVYKNCEVKFKK